MCRVSGRRTTIRGRRGARLRYSAALYERIVLGSGSGAIRNRRRGKREDRP